MGSLFKKNELPPPRDGIGRIMSVRVEKIIPNPHQPRRAFEPLALSALAESIKQHGILQPIAIRRIYPLPDTDRRTSMGDDPEMRLISDAVYLPGRPPIARPIYEIVAGERRFRAAQMLGMKEIPCLLLDCDEKQSAELAIVENIQRQELNPFEEAAAIASLIDLQSLTQKQAATRLAVSQSYVANKLRLLRFSAEERDLILTHGLTERHARALLRIESENDRLKTLRMVIARSLNVAQTEELTQNRLDSLAPDRTTQSPAKKRVVKDVRIFTNTIEHAVNAITRAGLEVSHEKREYSDAVEYIIRLPIAEKKH